MIFIYNYLFKNYMGVMCNPAKVYLVMACILLFSMIGISVYKKKGIPWCSTICYAISLTMCTSGISYLCFQYGVIAGWAYLIVPFCSIGCTLYNIDKLPNW